MNPKFTFKKTAFKKLEIIADNNEQYRHRSCLRIHRIEFKEGDDGDAMNEIEKCCNIMSIPFK